MRILGLAEHVTLTEQERLPKPFLDACSFAKIEKNAASIAVTKANTNG